MPSRMQKYRDLASSVAASAHVRAPGSPNEGGGRVPPHALAGAVRKWSDPWALSSSGDPRQVPDADKVVHGQGEREHPAHAAQASVAHLPTQPHGLGPSEDLFHALALLLAHGIARMPGRPPI